MKSFFLMCFLAILSCFLAAVIFLGIGFFINLFIPITAFQMALLLMAPFCCLLILFPLFLINQKMEEILVMFEEDYMWWEDDEWGENRVKIEKEKSRRKQKQSKIIVMGSSPIIDRNASCPCGSGKKYKNCCGEKGRSTKNEGD